MIKLYLHIIVFNINGKDINNVKNEKVIKKFKLNKFTNFEDFIGKNKKEIILTYFVIYFFISFFTFFSSLKLCFSLLFNLKNKSSKSLLIKFSLGNNKYGEDMSYLICSNILSKYLVETIDNNKNSLSQQNFWNNYIITRINCIKEIQKNY